MNVSLGEAHMAHRMFHILCLLAAVVLLPYASALTATPDGGFYGSNVTVTLHAAAGSTIKYTLDGSNPLENGTTANGSIAISARPSTPSALATNPDTMIFVNALPSSTLKATILRAVEIDANGTPGEELVRTYFIGHDDADFYPVVISIVAEQEYLDDYDIGMLVKGRTYANYIATHPGEENNPFADANWNNDSLRWPAHVELYDGGVRHINDMVEFYPSGRWSGALAQKSFKLKWDKDTGPKETAYPFFGNESLSRYTRIRLRQGSQDWPAGTQLRNCVTGEIIQGMNVEAEHCRTAEVFLNGEYWGSYSVIEDFDDKQLAQQYGIDDDDVVIIEQDGLLDEGSDNSKYFALKSWLATHNLSDPANWAYFESQVNVESMIDYYSVHMFFNNVDFGSDHRIWWNNGDPVPGTPADGRMYFEPKDRDQIIGLYSHSNHSDNTVQKFLDKPSSSWAHMFLVKAWENPGFRQRFANRSMELLDANFDSGRMNATIEQLADDRRPTLPRQIQRWGRPFSVGWWDSEVVEMKDWLAKRNTHYRGLIAGLNVTMPQMNGTNTTSYVLGVASIPSAGIVSVNGTDRGTSPLNLSLPAGSYLVSVRKGGYLTNSTTVLLDANKTVTIVLSAANGTNGTNSTDPYAIIAQLEARIAVLEADLNACLNQTSGNQTNTTPPQNNTLPTLVTLDAWQTYMHPTQCQATVCQWTVTYTDEPGSQYMKLFPATTSALGGGRVYSDKASLKLEDPAFGYRTLLMNVPQGSPKNVTMRVDKAAGNLTVSWSSGSNGAQANTVPVTVTGNSLSITAGNQDVVIHSISLQ